MLQFDLQFYEELTVAWVRTVKFISGAFLWPTGQLVYVVWWPSESLINPYLIWDLRETPCSSNIRFISSFETDNGICFTVSLSLFTGVICRPCDICCCDWLGFWSYSLTFFPAMIRCLLWNSSSLVTLSFRYTRHTLLIFWTPSSFVSLVALVTAVHIR